MNKAETLERLKAIAMTNDDNVNWDSVTRLLVDIHVDEYEMKCGPKTVQVPKPNMIELVDYIRNGKQDLNDYDYVMIDGAMYEKVKTKKPFIDWQKECGTMTQLHDKALNKIKELETRIPQEDYLLVVEEATAQIEELEKKIKLTKHNVDHWFNLYNSESNAHIETLNQVKRQRSIIENLVEKNKDLQQLAQIGRMIKWAMNNGKEFIDWGSYKGYLEFHKEDYKRLEELYKGDPSNEAF